MQRQHSETERVLWFEWVLATCAGAALGEIFSWSAPPEVSEFIAWVVVATLIGVAQWFVLRRHIQDAGWWVLASGIGGGLGWSIIMGAGMILGMALSRAAGEGVSLFVGLILGGVAAGITVGLVQAVVLQRSVQQAGWWVFANAVGTPLGLFMNMFSLLSVGARGSSLTVVGGVVAQGVIAAITGITLVWLLRHPVASVVKRMATAP